MKVAVKLLPLIFLVSPEARGSPLILRFFHPHEGPEEKSIFTW
jgi:hypothetical protein